LIKKQLLKVSNLQELELKKTITI